MVGNGIASADLDTSENIATNEGDWLTQGSAAFAKLMRSQRRRMLADPRCGEKARVWPSGTSALPAARSDLIPHPWNATVSLAKG